jgi:hypothetical protein
MSDAAKIPDGHERAICRLGDGEATCAFLTFGGDWLCAKAMADVAATIRSRLAAGSMVAKGDNCSGPPAFDAGAVPHV